MHILSPEDRVVLWRTVVESPPDERDTMLKVLAREALDSVGSKLDLYHGYEGLFVETFELLDRSGYLGRDDLRQVFEEAHTDDEAAGAFVALAAKYLREVADVDHVDAEARVRALDLAHQWGDLLAERPEARGEWLSVAHVAARFGVTPQAVYKWIREDKVDYEQRPGGSYRVPAAQFDTRTDRGKLRDLQKRLLNEHPDVSQVDDEEIVAEIRARRSG